MNYLKKTLCIISWCLVSTQMLHPEAIMTLFLRPYPSFPHAKYCKEISNSLKSPGALANYCIFGILDKRLIDGVFATYGGYLNVSDELGQLSFPYKGAKPIIKLLITNRLAPILMAGNTVHHWELEEKSQATMFTMERKQDEATQLYYWEVKPAKLPEDHIVPLNALVIIAKPHHIFVPAGITPTQESPHMILPDIYIKKGLNLLSHSFYMLNLRHLFGPIYYDYKNEPQSILSLIRT